MNRKNKKGEINPIFEKIGKYHYDNPKEHANGEFDVVTQDEKGYVFYEAKFRKNPINASIIENEIKQVKSTGLNCYKYVFISKSGFQFENNENVDFIDLDNLYNVEK